MNTDDMSTPPPKGVWDGTYNREGDEMTTQEGPAATRCEFCEREECGRVRNWMETDECLRTCVSRLERERDMWRRKADADLAAVKELGTKLRAAESRALAAEARLSEVEGARADDLRALGWMVAVHNDYRQDGQRYTFWLLTKGQANVKGEGRTDAEALGQIRAALSGSPSISGAGEGK